MAETRGTTLPPSSFSAPNILIPHLNLPIPPRNFTVNPSMSLQLHLPQPQQPWSPCILSCVPPNWSHHSQRGSFRRRSRLCYSLPRVLAYRGPYVYKNPQGVPTRQSRPQPVSWLTPHSPTFHLTILQTHWNSFYFINEPVTAQQSWRWAARPFLFPVLWSIFVNNLQRRHNSSMIHFLTPHVRDPWPFQFTPPQGSAQMSLSKTPGWIKSHAYVSQHFCASAHIHSHIGVLHSKSAWPELEAPGGISAAPHTQDWHRICTRTVANEPTLAFMKHGYFCFHSERIKCWPIYMCISVYFFHSRDYFFNTG